MAVRADAEWTGADLLDGDTSVRVVRVPSPLAVRDAPRRPRTTSADELLVMLTPCTDRDLGLDVRARLIKGRVLSLDPFAVRAGAVPARQGSRPRPGGGTLAHRRAHRASPAGWLARATAGQRRARHRRWPGGLGRSIASVSTDVPASLDDVLGSGERPDVAAALSSPAPAEPRPRSHDRWAGGRPPVATMVRAARRRSWRPSSYRSASSPGVLWAPTDDAGLARQQASGAGAPRGRSRP